MRKQFGLSASRWTDGGQFRHWRRLASFSGTLALGVLWSGASGLPLQAQSASQASAQSQSGASSQSAVKHSNSVIISAPAQKSTAHAAKPLTVAEASRIARAQHAAEKSAHVYTNDDLAKVSGTISVVGDASNSGAIQESDAGNQTANGGGQQEQAANGGSGQGEQYWRAKAQAIKDQIAAIDRRIADEKAQIDKGGAVGFDPTAGLAQNVIIVHDRNADIKGYEDQKADLEKQLDNLADQCRQAGGDPGWVR